MLASLPASAYKGVRLLEQEPGSMHISCPSCTTNFSVPDQAVGPYGRTMKCGRCGHKWLVEGEAPAETAAPERNPFEEGDFFNSAANRSDDPTPDFGKSFATPDNFSVADDDGPRFGSDDHAFDFDSDRPRPNDDRDLDLELDEPPVPDFVSNRATDHTPPPLDLDPNSIQDPTPFAKRDQKKGTGGLWILLLIMLLGAIGGGIYTFQDKVIGWWPGAHDLLSDLGLRREKAGAGLELRNAGTPERFVQDNAEMLVVRGIIANISDRERKVPALRLVLLDKDKKQVQDKIQPPPVPSLDPGGTAGFRIVLDRPNATAVEVNVMFEESK